MCNGFLYSCESHIFSVPQHGHYETYYDAEQYSAVCGKTSCDVIFVDNELCYKVVYYVVLWC